MIRFFWIKKWAKDQDWPHQMVYFNGKDPKYQNVAEITHADRLMCNSISSLRNTSNGLLKAYLKKLLCLPQDSI